MKLLNADERTELSLYAGPPGDIYYVPLGDDRFVTRMELVRQGRLTVLRMDDIGTCFLDITPEGRRALAIDEAIRRSA